MIAPDNVLSFVKLSPLIDSIDVQEIGSENDWTTPLVSNFKIWCLTRQEGSHKKAEGPSNVIHFNKGHLVQERFLPPVPKVFGP